MRPADEARRRELQRRIEESSASIRHRVSEIRDVAGDSLGAVKESLDELAEWRENAAEDPLVWSLGALAAGLALGYSLGHAQRSNGGKASGGLAGLAETLVRDAGAVGEEVVLPRLNENIRRLFGWNFQELLTEMATAASRERSLVRHGSAEPARLHHGNGSQGTLATQEVVMAARSSPSRRRSSAGGSTSSKSSRKKSGTRSRAAGSSGSSRSASSRSGSGRSSSASGSGRSSSTGSSRSRSAGSSKKTTRASSSSSARGKSSSTSRGSSSRSRSGSSSKLTTQAKDVGKKVLAGAVAGAVKAVIPPLERAAGETERMSGMRQRSSDKSES